jgi:Protein of unknown function DUF262/Protein of unknown function (DUF1524)
VKNVYSFAELFAGRLFRVPDYQRGYAWETRQRRELLEDLEVLPVGRSHYTGTLVLHRHTSFEAVVDEEGGMYELHDVVDGQQRLTTLVILLNVLRDALARLASAQPLADGIRKAYVAATDPNGVPLYKLRLNADTNDYFRDAVIGDGVDLAGAQVASEERLADARREFQQYLAERRGEDDGEYERFLRNLHVKVTAQLKWTLYEVDAASDVGVIFEVMNDRGKPLTELEKVKNYLLYVGSKLDLDENELSHSVNTSWAQVLQQLMAAHLSAGEFEDQLLRAHWLTVYDSQPRKWQGARSVKDRFSLRRFEGRHPDLLKELTGYAKGLRATSVAYADARNPRRDEAFNSYADQKAPRVDILRWSEKLVRLNVMAPLLPLLIAIRHRFPDDAGTYHRAVQLLEAYAFRVYSLLRRRADAGQATLFRAGHDLYHDAISFDVALREVRSALAAYCPRATFESALRNSQNWYEWGGLKYFLYEYEEHLARRKGALPLVPWEYVRTRDKADTIEHVLPQTPSAPYWVERFSDEECRELTHDLGNLVLTKSNASYSNKPFPEKRGDLQSTRPCYAGAALLQERELAALDDWRPTELVERRERLITWALERWAVDEEDVDESLVQSEDADDELGEPLPVDGVHVE